MCTRNLKLLRTDLEEDQSDMQLKKDQSGLSVDFLNYIQFKILRTNWKNKQLY